MRARPPSAAASGGDEARPSRPGRPRTSPGSAPPRRDRLERGRARRAPPARRARGSSRRGPCGRRRGVDQQPALRRAGPQWTTGSRPRGAPGARSRARHVARERAAAQHAPSSTTSAPLWSTSGTPAAELLGHAARRRVAAPVTSTTRTPRARACVDRRARARRDRPVAAQQRAVDVERDEPDAPGAGGLALTPRSRRRPARSRRRAGSGRRRPCRPPPGRTACSPRRGAAGARSVMKNWLPPVSLPESAMPTAPRP